MSDRPKPLKAWVKVQGSDKRLLSFQALIWPNGGVQIELSELRGTPGQWWSVEKGYTTIGQLYDFWIHLGRILSNGGVNPEAMAQQILGVEVEA